MSPKKAKDLARQQDLSASLAIGEVFVGIFPGSLSSQLDRFANLLAEVRVIFLICNSLAVRLADAFLVSCSSITVLFVSGI